MQALTYVPAGADGRSKSAMNDSVARGSRCWLLIADASDQVYDDLPLRLLSLAQCQGTIGRSRGAVGLEDRVGKLAKTCPVPAVFFWKQLLAQQRLTCIAAAICVEVVEDR